MDRAVHGKRNLVRHCISVLALMSVVFSSGCGDIHVPLPNGYFLAGFSADQFGIVAPDRRVVVGPTVDSYNVYGTLVVGHVTPPEGRPSYFIVDTRKNTVDAELNEAEWRKRLAALKLASPKLVRPMRFRILSHNVYSG
jgi:hypothetical protein